MPACLLVRVLPVWNDLPCCDPLYKRLPFHSFLKGTLLAVLSANPAGRKKAATLDHNGSIVLHDDGDDLL